MNFKNQSRRNFIGASLAALAVGLTASTEPNAQTTEAKTTAKIETGAAGAPLEIAILLYDKMTALDAVGPYEVLSRLPNATVKFVGETAGLKTADTKMLTLRADYSIDEVPKPDILLIPGGDARGPRESKKVMDWVRSAHKTSKYTVSVCTGALILGAAELLRGQPATTHWAVAKMLENSFGAKYVAERYVQTGKIITSAGVSAGIDAALYLVEKLTDKQTAQIIQLSIEYDPQPHVNTGSIKKADKETIEATKKYFADRRIRAERAK